SNDVVRANRWDHQKLVDSIREAPQARRPLNELAISVFVDGELRIDRLRAEDVEDDPDRPPVAWELPASVIVDETLSTGESTAGKQAVRKAAKPLAGRRPALNSVMLIVATANPRASYPG